jgi:hypothetical protein
MFKRRRRAVLVAFALAVVGAFSFTSQASAGTQTYTNACRNSAVGTNWDQITVTFTGNSPAFTTPGASVPYTNNSLSTAIPGAIFVAGYNLGLLTTGTNNIPATVHAVIDAPNTVQLSQSTNNVDTTLTTVITDPDGTPGSGDETATDASTSVTFNDMTWTAGASGAINFHEHNDTAINGVSGGGVIAIAHLFGGAINVQFHCTSGTVTGSNPGVPTFSDAPTITSTYIDSGLPVANAGPDQLTVPAGNSVTLDGSGSTDSDLPNDTLSYQWTQTSGPAVTLSDPTAVMPTFTTGTPGPDTYTFDLTVTDQVGQTSTDSVTITTVPAGPVDNFPPVANAGPDQLNVTAGTLVTLDGSGSTDGDLPNDTLSYQWTQTAGPAVTLSDPTAVMPTFTMPGSDVTFQLTVTDQAGKTSTDSVTITAAVIVVSDASGQVIVNGPVKAGQTAKTYVFKVTNTGNQTLTINPTTDIAGTVTINGTANGSVSSLTGTKTLSPGSSARFRLRWTGTTALATGDTVVFSATVTVAGDPTPADNTDSASFGPLS